MDKEEDRHKRKACRVDSVITSYSIHYTKLYELVVRFASLDLEQDFLDLGRENVDPLDDQHVVGATHGLGHAHVGAAAGARGMIEPGDA